MRNKTVNSRDLAKFFAENIEKENIVAAIFNHFRLDCVERCNLNPSQFDALVRNLNEAHDSDLDVITSIIDMVMTGQASAYDKENDVEISSFLKYIKTQEATDDFTIKLNSFVEKAKQNQELRSYYLSMNIHDSDIRRVALAEGKQIGLLEGAEQKAIETAKNLIKEGLSAEQIARCTDLPLEKVQELANSQQG